MKQILIACLFLMTAPNAFAQETAVPKDAMRCGKVQGKTLAEFKEELVNNCDLNKPFSTSLSRLLNEDTYMYCCHKQK